MRTHVLFLTSLSLSRHCVSVCAKKKKMALPLLRIPGMPLTNQHQSFPSNTRRKATTAKAELGTAVARTGGAGYQSPSVDVPTHKVTVHDRQRGIVHEFVVPEDQYILHTAEAQNITLPFACRHGCCTSCAVRIKKGQIRQPEALGISAELRDKGYALLCVGFPTSDVEVETQDEDENISWNQ
ncbi:Ferredoxin C 2, chloroplastic isoform B [Glycine soja]|nr:Ferredoxin C 2, chloroplastic isoform B [Glycine soja]